MNSVIGFFARKTVNLGLRLSFVFSMANAFLPNNTSSSGMDQPVEENPLIYAVLCFISLGGLLGIGYTCYKECNKQPKSEQNNQEAKVSPENLQQSEENPYRSIP